MLGRGVGERIATKAPEAFWGNTLTVLRSADVVIANLECAITRSSKRWLRTPKVFHFRAPPAAVKVLQAAGIRLVSLANNHVLDYETEGLLETIAQLDAASIAHAGAGANLAAAAAPAIVTVNGIRVGLVAFTDNEPTWAAAHDRAGTNFIRISCEDESLDRVRAGVAAARAQGAHLVVLSLHWGPNMNPAPTPEFRAFARAAVKLGADLIFGHSAHIVQGLAVYQRVPVFYDLGDYLDDYAIDPELRNDWSFIALLNYQRNIGWPEITLLPVRLSYAEVNLARAAEAAEIMKRMSQRSARLGTTLLADHASLRLEIT